MSPDRDASSERAGKHSLAIMTGCWLSLALLFHVYVYAPISERISDLREQIQSAWLQADRQKQSRVRAPELERQLAQLRKELEERIGKIPRVGDRPVLLQEISKRAQTAGLSVVRFRPGGERRREGYTILPLELSLDGNFHNFVRFLRALARVPQLNKLGNLTILSPDSFDPHIPLRASLEFLTYRVPQQPDEQRTHTLAISRRKAGERFVASEVSEPLTETGLSESLRDPFRPAEVIACNEPVNSLERYDLNELQLVGIVWDLDEPKGLVMDGAESGHIVVPGTRIGNRGGIVKAITPTHVFVEEPLPEGAGAPRSTSLEVPKFTRAPRATPGDQEARGTPPLVPELCVGS